MKRILILLLGLLALWLSSPLSADGKVWPRIGHAKVNIPDQRALIHYTNGVERLVIETSFVGPGTNFAWGVPPRACRGRAHSLEPTHGDRRQEPRTFSR